MPVSRGGWSSQLDFSEEVGESQESEDETVQLLDTAYVRAT